MSRNLGRSPWLLGGAGALGAAILAFIGFGQLRKDIDVPRPLLWDHSPVVVCPEAGVDRQVLGKAAGRWREHGYAARLGEPGDTDCDVRVVVDAGLDDRDSVEDDGFVHGRTSLLHDGPTIQKAEIRVLPPGDDLLVHVHELGHALGHQHPVNAPSGHVLHPSRPGLDDWRGLTPGSP